MEAQKNPFLRLDREGPRVAFGDDVAPTDHVAPPIRHVLFPAAYTWFVFLAAMDVMMTWIVLWVGGREANVLAHWVLNRWDLPGMAAFKFMLVIGVVWVCEVVGRRNLELGRSLAYWAVALNVVPVTLAFVQLLIDRFG